jgi:dolichyl-diphosphooligosaccharide--protein glycosyltransferase
MMSQSRFSPGLIAGIIVALFFGVALYLRVALPYDQVFVGDWIKFTGVDAYYHMRLVDNLIHNFPNLITFDPYTFYPYGALVGWLPFFDWFLAGVTLLVGLGSPTQHTIDVVGVYFPAVLGALTVIPVYFIGKELFNRWAGVIAAGLIAILPGEFLGRSILGFTDHHVAEVLFTTIAVLFLILAVKSARQKELTFNHLRKRNWAAITKPLVYSMLAGIFLGIYLLTWTGGLLFVFITFIYFVIQFIIDHLRGKSTDYLGIVGTVSFLFALAISPPLLPQVSSNPLYLASLPIAILATVLLSGISRLLTSKEIKPAYYPLALVGLGLAGLGIFYAFNPTLLSAILGLLGYFNPTTTTTILEAQPLLLPGGNFSFSVAWGNFTTGLFLSFMSLGILIYFIIKRGEADKTLFIVWSLVILAATLGQRRFAYYFAVNVALLSGYLSWLILEFAGFKERATEPVESPREVKKKAKQKKRQKSASHLSGSRVNMAFGVIVVFFLSFFPNIGGAMNTASRAAFAPSDAWCKSLSWLKENTPDPFGNPDFYYELYEPPPSGESYNYPETAYGVMAWWDYGHWITRIARRLPNATPALWGSCAPFFSAEDEAAANRLMDELGLKYVIVDHAIAMPTGKFHAVATLSGSSWEKFYDVYFQQQDSRLKPVILFYPEYYRSLVIRLYNFGGSQVDPKSTTVVSYEERVTGESQPYKEITSMKSFPSYKEAEAYVASQKSGNYKVVSPNPFVSPVPLEALEHYKLIYSSDSSVMEPGIGMISEVKIFEYVKSE